MKKVNKIRDFNEVDRILYLIFTQKLKLFTACYEVCYGR